MNENLRFIFRVIAAVVTGGQMPELPEGIDWNLIYAVCARHNIANIFAYGLSKKKYTGIPDNIGTEFSNTLYYNLAIDQKQQNEIRLIFDSFENQGLEYMPLKGTLLKQMYPSSDMRRMGDIDILIRKDNYEDYKNIMDELGYTFVKESNNEYVYSKKGVLVELHRYLITPGNDDMFAYYETGWDIAKRESEDSFKYILSKEDEFVYIITHFAKHYRNAGCGIKPLIDIWLYMKKHDLDTDYINKQLEELNLYKFAQSVFKLIDVWFEDKETDTLTQEMTKFILMSGEYGSVQNSSAAEAIRGKYSEKKESSVRISSYWKMLFLNRKGMYIKYPVLRKAPILLPFFWIYRILEVLLFKRDRISANKNKVDYKFGDNVDRYNMHMDIVGLDIYNGRENR